MTQAAAVLWIVGVEAALLELAPAERVMVGDGGECPRPRVAAEDAADVAFEDTDPEPLPVLLPVASPGR